MRYLSSLITLTLASVLAMPAQAAGSWAPTRTQAYPVRTTHPTAVDNGEIAAGQLTHVAVSLAMRNKAELDALTARILAGDNSLVISDQRFLDRYAPTLSQVQQVVTHLRTNGFRNIEVSSNRLLVTADGSVGTVKSAFNTTLHQYNVNGRIATANVNPVQVPRALSRIVLAIHGLQDVNQFSVQLRPYATTAATVNSSSVLAHKPTDFPLIYNANTLAAAKNTTVGIIAEGNISQTLTDLATFQKNSGFAPVSTKVITVRKATTDTSGLIEWNLDSQSIMAAAGGALKQLQFYVSPSMSNADITATINAAVTLNTAKVINISLGECEVSAYVTGMTASTDQLFQMGVVRGQTFAVSTGDSGSNECGGSVPYQSYPAVSPYVVAVGGTTLATTGTTAFASESAWVGTGGGMSYTEAAPAWQVNSGVMGTNKTRRGVPDIAFDADPKSGALILLAGRTYQVGGTSLSAPLFSGFWARIQSANGNKFASPAASIYKYFKANPTLYRDVTSGSNGAFRAAASWDYTTGWGSLNIANFNSFASKTAGF